MGDVVKLHKEFTAVEMLEGFLEQAYAGELASLVVIARETNDRNIRHRARRHVRVRTTGSA